MSRVTSMGLGALTALLLAGSGVAGERPAAARTNLLVLIADDVGVDKIGAYREGECHAGRCPAPPATPSIDGLAARGVLFRNAWSNPVCSATRATLLSGRYGFRTGVGGLTPERATATRRVPGLDAAAPNLAHELRRAGYATAVFGKWHLAGCPNTDPSSGECRASAVAFVDHHPILSGFDLHEGTLTNFASHNDYCYWRKTKSRRTGPGADDYATATALVHNYATTETVDDALAHLKRISEPWFLWVAFNASHTPFHVAPDEPLDCAARQSRDPVAMYDGMTTRMDAEIGRLLEGLGKEVLARTTVVFTGDNGTPADAIVPPFDAARGKGSVYEGGINVPFVVAGPAVAAEARGRESAALVNTTDLFATLLDVAGVERCAGCGEDSLSLRPYLEDPSLGSRREFAFAEFFFNTRGRPAKGWQAIREARFKLIRRYGARDAGLRLFDLSADPFEKRNLLAEAPGPEASAALARLGAELGRLLGVCVDPADLDGDCVPDAMDNCPRLPNGPAQRDEAGVGDQLDSDGDGRGDACEGRQREPASPAPATDSHGRSGRRRLRLPADL